MVVYFRICFDGIPNQEFYEFFYAVESELDAIFISGNQGYSFYVYGSGLGVMVCYLPVVI